ncbi:Gfo/Idh/MocA family protein [Ekhidna sp.]|uniref:Gfo/Idh/MocA family protein n=1 Tax=Ekhidna sp. TaxID=2608089 RepID=UPI003B503338
MSKDFALIGAAGYIAPRHMKAIKETGNYLIASVDKNDSVGIIDSYFPQSSFFTEFERFDRHIDKLRREGRPISYVSICTPNYLHDAHIRFGLRNAADVICEKPLVLNPWNIDALETIEKESGKKINNILQLRLHPSLVALKKKVDKEKSKTFDVDLTYITSRGSWYYTSWKGEQSKSGGIATNIGIHFFDMLHWIFGSVKKNSVHVRTHDRASGVLELNKANVRWFLSINSETLPKDVKKKGQATYRSITIEGKEIEFSGGFTDLHTRSYESILEGNGFGLEEARSSIEIAHDIRHAEPMGLVGDYHPYAKSPLSNHPFDKY